MKYQLVVQWPADSIKDYDALIEAEDALSEQFTDKHEVDGHDVGSAEMNIFVLTNDFGKAFEEAKVILQAEGLWKGVRLAYRETDKSRYTVLWPKGLKEFKVT